MDDIINNTPETDNTVNDTNLDLDYMLSLKLHLETEHNIPEDNDNIIFELIQYLYEMNIPNDRVKTAMHLLYDNIDPDKKEIIDKILAPNRISNIFSNFANQLLTNDTINEHIDSFTGDIINPANILNIFTENLNNLQNNYPNFQITFDPSRLNTSFQFRSNFGFPLLEYTFDITPEHTPESILEKNTEILVYQNLDDTLKSKYNTCFICLADFESDDIIRKIKCDHIFHKDCIDPWIIKESYKCPACRCDI
jgi:hypothetical protein